MDDESREDQRIERDLRNYPDREIADRPIEHRHDLFLMFVSVFVAVGVGVGVHSTLPGDGVMHNFMVVFVGLVAGTLSSFANKTAFWVGSKLAASGDRVAIALCVSWFMLMAITFGTIGFSGVSRDVLEGAKLQAPLAFITSSQQKLGASSAKGGEVVEAVRNARVDIEALRTCEAVSGCLSGRSGRGRQYAELGAISQKFMAIEQRYAQSARERAKLIARLGQIAADYERQLNAGGVGGENRAALLAIYVKAQAVLTDLEHSVPTAAVRALVGELRGFRSSSGFGGRLSLSERLRDHADRMEALLPDVGVKGSTALPPFPKLSGIAAGWERLDLTWPYAILLFGLEGIVSVLWLFLVRDFVARRRAAKLKQSHDDDPPTYVRRGNSTASHKFRLNGADHRGPF